jgi:hypothetical protein
MKKINIVLISVSVILGITLVGLLILINYRRNMTVRQQPATQDQGPNGSMLQADGSVAVEDVETIVVPAINGGRGEPAPTAPAVNLTVTPAMFTLESGNIRPARLQVEPDQRVLIQNLEESPVTVVIPPLPQNNNITEVIIPPRETYMLVTNRLGRYDIEIKGKQNSRALLEVFSEEIIKRLDEKGNN